MHRPRLVAVSQICSIALLSSSFACAGSDTGRTTLGVATVPATVGSNDTGDMPDPSADDEDGFFDDDGDDFPDDGPDDGSQDSTGDETGNATSDGGTGDENGDDTGTDGGPLEPTMLLHFNYEGAFLSAGMDDAPDWISQTISSDEDIPAHTDSARALQILAVLEDILSDYPIEIVTEDPGLDATYTMVVVADIAPTSGFPSGVVSVGPTDCGNDNPNNVLLAFDNPTQDFTVTTVANAIAFSVGGSVGLNPNTTPGDAMNSTASDGQTSFTDVCVDFDTGVCRPIGAGGCSATQQNSHQALLAALE